MTGRSRHQSFRLALCAVVVVGTGIVAGSAGVAAGTSAGRAPLVQVTPRHAQGRSGTENSLNWAGYAVSGTTFSSVSGGFVQPTVTCTKNSNQQDATWIGIDGFSSSDPTVEQIGADGDCVKSKGKTKGTPSYYAWYEMYPAPPVLLPTGLYPVAPGDSFSASVTVVGSSYTLDLTDGLKWTFATVQLSASPRQDSSAEWITEAPTRCTGSSCSVVQLADFGVLNFSGAHADALPVSSTAFSDTMIDMTLKNGKRPKARTSGLTSAGTSFTVTWLHK